MPYNRGLEGGEGAEWCLGGRALATGLALVRQVVVSGGGTVSAQPHVRAPRRFNAAIVVACLALSALALRHLLGLGCLPI